MQVKNAAWISLEPESLRIKIKDQDQTEMAFLDDKYIKNTRGGEDRNYIFMIDPSENEGLKRLTGSEIDAELLHTLPKSCKLVPKLDLSLHGMGKSTAVEWKQLVSELFPGAELIAEGLEHLAIYVPENTAKN